MPQIKDVLKHVEVEVASKARKCHRNSDHRIKKGETCLVIRGGAYNATRNYCRECAEPILKLAEKRTKDLRGGLGV